MTCGTPLLLGIVRLVHRRISYSVLVDGKHSQWSRGMRTLRQRACGLRRVGYRPRSVDALRPFLAQIEAHILMQAGVAFDAKAAPGALRVVEWWRDSTF